MTTGRASPLPARVTISVVTYRPDAPLLARSVASLAESARQARAAGELSGAALFLVDNGPPEFAPAVREAARAWPADLGVVEILAGHGNVGYGRGNNLVLASLDSEAHLVMNPDVEVDPGALAAALAFLREHPGVGLVAPASFGPDGGREYLCKRYPSLWVLLLRGFAPQALRRRFARTLEAYEMRDAIGERVVEGIPLASGCFMFLRTEIFRRLGGFDPRFFLYFEDYDLSLRLARQAGIAYVPSVRIVHHGGGASRKGLAHIARFVASAVRFQALHGWRLT